MKQGRRWTALALGSVLCLGLLPAAASASTAASDGTTLSVAAASGEENVLTISYFLDGSDLTYKYLITEQGAGVPLTESSDECEPFNASPPQVACDATTITAVTADGNDQDDVIQTNGANPLSVPIAVNGGNGKDTLTGGQAGEKLRGGRGNDDINAGGLIVDDPGDVLIGGKGRDRLFGDYGHDLIKAKDRERDKLIDCGPGDDPKPIRDKGLDPKPVNCENVP